MGLARRILRTDMKDDVAENKLSLAKVPTSVSYVSNPELFIVAALVQVISSLLLSG